MIPTADEPRDGQRVEVLVNGAWLPAKFIAADSIASSDPEQDELWWMGYFLIDESGDTVPDDITSGDLPPWRPID